MIVFVRRTRHSFGFVTQILTVSSTVDAEIDVHSLDNPELSNFLLSNPGVGQNIATHALSAVSYLSVISNFHVQSNFSYFLPFFFFFFFFLYTNLTTVSLPYTLPAQDLRVGPRNKAHHPARHHESVTQSSQMFAFQRVGQNIATHASSADSYLSLISNFHVNSNFFSYFIQISNINTNVILYVNCFGRTMLYMCIEYHF